MRLYPAALRIGLSMPRLNPIFSMLCDDLMSGSDRRVVSSWTMRPLLSERNVVVA
jgi:hypothetical protein